MDPVNEEFVLVNGWINSDVSSYSSPILAGTSVLYKITMDAPMKPNMTTYTNIAAFDHGFDGQVFSADGQYLYVASSSAASAVYQFSSDDNWDSMTLNQVKTTQYSSPTAVQLAQNGAYGTNVSQSVYVSCALGFSGVPAYPLELLDFSNDASIVIKAIEVEVAADTARLNDSVFWIAKNSIFPESFRYYSQRNLGFITGSLALGGVWHLQPATSSSNGANPMNFSAAEYFANDDLQFTLGLEIDFQRNVMFVCHANPNAFNLGVAGDLSVAASWNATYGFMGGVMVVDLDANEMIANFDFQDYNVDPSTPLFHLCNDIVIDSAGNAYATDSFGGAIYKISYDSSNSATPYSLSLFSYTDEWQIPAYIFFDGISMDPVNEEFVLVNGWINSNISKYSSPAISGTSHLWKIPLDTPMQPTICSYTNVVSFSAGFDGQVMSADGQYLYAVLGGTQSVYRFTSSDNWDSLTLDKVRRTDFPIPTAVQMARNGPYGTGVSESVYVSHALSFSGETFAAYPIELIDFRDTVVIETNYTNTVYIQNHTCGNAQNTPLADSLAFINQNLLVEAFRYYTTNDLGFLTGSMSHGSIFQLHVNGTSSDNDNNPRNFSGNVFFSDSNLKWSTALEIDFTRNVMFICHSNSTTFPSGLTQDPAPGSSSWTDTFMSGVMVVNLTTKTVIADFDLQDHNVDASNPMYHLANDLVVDESDGSAYITDSYGGAIYRISYDASDAVPYSIAPFSYLSEWQVPGYIFFNGIALDVNKQFLMVNGWINANVSKYSSPMFAGHSVMVKVPLSSPLEPTFPSYANIASFSSGFDGQAFSADGTYLYVVGNAQQSVFRFVSSDNWDTLRLDSVRMTQYGTPTCLQLAASGTYGTGVTESVFVSAVPGFTKTGPFEVLDFRRSVVINNTNSSSSNSGNSTSGSSEKGTVQVNAAVFWALIAVVIALAIVIIVLTVFVVRLRRASGTLSSNVDYHQM